MTHMSASSQLFERAICTMRWDQRSRVASSRRDDHGVTSAFEFVAFAIKTGAAKVQKLRALRL